MSKTYITPLNIPAGKLGNVEIVREVKPPGTEMPLNNIRTKFFGQKGPDKIVYSKPTTWHQLLIDGSRMMSDWPIEQRQHDSELTTMKGNVLVGGLGLGYAVTMIMKKTRVRRIVVVEENKNVIDLVWRYLTVHKRLKPASIIHGDLFDFLKAHAGKMPFDTAFYDIWASDGEGTFHSQVCPLYELSKGVVQKPPVCWNEDVMRGQLKMSLWHRCAFADGKLPPGTKMPDLCEYDGTDQPWHNWAVTFFRWKRDVADKLKVAHEREGRLNNALDFYAAHYGKQNWQTIWEDYTTWTSKQRKDHWRTRRVNKARSCILSSTTTTTTSP